MKLTRNKIRKIRKQQHQSVRKWKKARNSIRRKVLTFRQTPHDLVPKRKNVFNKTLKQYIPPPVLCYLKQKYIEMRQMRRKHRKEQQMMGGKGVKLDPKTSAKAKAIAISAVATAKANRDSKKNDPKNKDEEDQANPDAEGEDVNAAGAGDGEGEEGKTDAGVEGEGGEDQPEAGAEGEEGKKEEGAADGDKKKGSFSLGPEIPGDVSINSETHEYKDTKRLLDFLVKKGLPYYIQIELKSGTTLELKNTDIFDLRRILIGKFVKTPTKTDVHLKTGGEYVGIAEGDTITNEYPNDVFIFTKDKVSIDTSSDENKVVVVTDGKDDSSKKTLPPLPDSKRLYKLSGDSPSSIDDTDEITKADVTATDEFRLQVAPLSQDEMKAALTAAPSEDGKKKKKKIVTDDTPTYVVNLNDKCKITSIQTLRKSLEVVRGDLEDEDNISKTDAMGIFKMLTALLQNPEFAKNDGFDDFKEQVYGFTYKIPGTERKYGFIQLMSFFEQKKDDMPPALTKEFFKVLTLLGHGPAGENGACLAFERPQALEVIEYIKTLENGDIVTTKKLGSKMNIEGLGSELDKLNGPNEPKEEDEKKEEGEGEEGAAGEEEAAGEEAAKEGEDGEEAKEGEEEAAGEEATEEGEAEEKEEAAEEVKDGEEAKEEEGTPKPHDNNSLPAASDVEEINAVSLDKKYKAYIIKHFKFPTSPEMVLVNFMGWGPEYDEIMALKDSKLSSPRSADSIEGPRQSQIADTTKEDVIKLYTAEKIKSWAGKAEELSKELENDNKKAATSIAAAAVAAARAASAAQTKAANHISPAELPKEPITPPQEIIAINKLYEKYDKKTDKIKKIISLKKLFNAGLTSMVKLLLNIFTKSLKSFNKSEQKNPQNTYRFDNEYKETKTKLDKELKEFKKSKDFKLIGASEYSCDEIVSEFKPSDHFWNRISTEQKDILMKICKLFSLYASVSLKIDQYYQYFNDWEDMKGARFGTPTARDVANEFEKSIDVLNALLPELNDDVNETKELEKQLLNNSTV